MEFEAESPGSHNATVEYDDYRQQLTDKILEERRSQCHHLSDSFDINGQLINRPLLDGGVIFEFFGASPDTEQAYCPPVFDGWSCWNATPAGNVAFVSCPYFITGFDPQSKICFFLLIHYAWLNGRFSTFKYTSTAVLAGLQQIILQHLYVR